MNVWIEYVMDNYKYYMMDTTKKDYRMDIIEYSPASNVIKLVSLYCDSFEYYKGELCVYFNEYLDYKRSIHTNKIKVIVTIDNKKEYLYSNNFITKHEKHGTYGTLIIYPIKKTLKFMYKKK